MEETIRVEFHCHTVYSRDSLNGLKRLLRACDKKGIDRLVITDHNTIAGARRAREMDAQRVIVGEEIITQEGGEILAFFVEEEVLGGLPAKEALSLLKEQGAFVSLAHPFDYRRHGWTRARLEEVLPYLDAIEVFNARTLTSEVNHRAARFAAEHQLAGTVGSDAHTLFELGRATVQMPVFNTAEELRQVIWRGQPNLKKSSILVHGSSRIASLVHALAPKIGQE